jgi:hypothetical protein
MKNAGVMKCVEVAQKQQKKALLKGELLRTELNWRFHRSVFGKVPSKKRLKA